MLATGVGAGGHREGAGRARGPRASLARHLRRWRRRAPSRTPSVRTRLCDGAWRSRAFVKHCGFVPTIARQVSLADVCLIPQLYNARRFGCSLEDCPTLLAIEGELDQQPACLRGLVGGRGCPPSRCGLKAQRSAQLPASSCQRLSRRRQAASRTPNEARSPTPARPTMWPTMARI
jgi:hypothetical protein